MDFSHAKPMFEGARITLRVMEERDATERYAGWLNDPEVNRYLATKHATVEELRDYIKKKDLQSDALFFGVFLKTDGMHIGTVKLEPIDLKQKQATIAVMIGDKAYWGKGYAGVAMQLLIDWCFSTLGIEEMNLGLVAKNTAGMQAYRKLGFEEVKRDLASVRYGDEVHDQVWMMLKRKVQPCNVQRATVPSRRCHSLPSSRNDSSGRAATSRSPSGPRRERKQ